MLRQHRSEGCEARARGVSIGRRFFRHWSASHIMSPVSRVALLFGLAVAHALAPALALGASLAPLMAAAQSATEPGAEPAAAIPAEATPLLLRVQVATVATGDLAGFESRFTKWLGYEVRARGRVSRALAASWGAAREAGRPYVLLSSHGSPDVYVRGVEEPVVQGYVPLTTFGWNGIEIVVQDPDALREALRGSPFEVIGEPAGLARFPTIRAFQVEVTGHEVLYLTGERGDPSHSPLPPPNGAVGRPFIMVLAGPDIDALLRFYAENFQLGLGKVVTRSASLLAGPQGMPLDTPLPVTTGRLAEHGNLIEFDGYSTNAKPRTVATGELPPGVAMASFAVASLDALQLPYIAPAHVEKAPPYAGRRTATLRGPAGELIELIEE
jgi:hypothetical protein